MSGTNLRVGLAVVGIVALLAVIGCTAPGTAPLPSPTSALESTLVVNSCGGLYGEAIQSAYIAPFEADTGIDVTYDDDCDAQTTQLAAQSEAGQVQWDVIAGFGGPLYADLHKQGLLQTIDHAALGSAAMDLADGSTEPFGLGFHNDAVVIGYSGTAFPDEAPSVADYFDPAGHPGTRAMTIGGFEDWTRPALALVADGVAPADLIPLDWDRAFAAMDPIKDDVVWYQGGTGMLTTMLEKQADICLCSDARMLQAQKEDSDIRVSYEGGTRALVYWAIPADAPHPNAALAFLRSTLDAQRQASFTETIGYSGVVEDSYDLLPADLQTQVLVNPENYSQTWSFTPEQNAWLAEHASEASDKYATWTGQ